MKKIYTNKQDKHDQQSFLHVSKTTGMIQEGETYCFLEYGNRNYIKHAYCVSVRTININQLTPEISFLDQNCELDVYKTIMDARRIGKTDLLTIAVFTNSNNVRKLVEESREVFNNKHYAGF